jgi:hypothetical protein
LDKLFWHKITSNLPLLVWYHVDVTLTNSFSLKNNKKNSSCFFDIILMKLEQLWTLELQFFIWCDFYITCKNLFSHQYYIKKLIRITLVPWTLSWCFFDTTFKLLYCILLIPFWCYFHIIITINILMSIDCYKDTILKLLQYIIIVIILIKCKKLNFALIMYYNALAPSTGITPLDAILERPLD